MGKQNRSKRRKNKSSFNRSPLALIESKEVYIENLVHIFATYLRLFENCVNNRIESKPPVNFNRISIDLKVQNCELFYQHDESREFHHIFYAHLQQFLGQVLMTLRDLDGFKDQLIIPCINDALVMLESARMDIEKVTNFLFNSINIDCKKMIFLIFHENLVKDKFVQRMIQEDGLKDEEIFGFLESSWIFKDFTMKTPKKRKRNKGKKVEEAGSEVDEEVYLFEQRLLCQKNLKDKAKPNVTFEWIQGLRRALMKSN